MELIVLQIRNNSYFRIAWALNYHRIKEVSRWLVYGTSLILTQVTASHYVKRRKNCLHYPDRHGRLSVIGLVFAKEHSLFTVFLETGERGQRQGQLYCFNQDQNRRKFFIIIIIIITRLKPKSLSRNFAGENS